MGLLDWLWKKKSSTVALGKLVLHTSQYCLDGGTTILKGIDESNRDREVMLVQSMFQEMREFGIPGRLYLDGELVPVRSELESQVLAMLRASEIRSIPTKKNEGKSISVSPNALILSQDIKDVLTRGPEENIRALRDQVIEKVESPQYLTLTS
jgi:hypothetical protein